MCSDVYLNFIAGINTDRSDVWALLAYIIAFGEDNSKLYHKIILLFCAVRAIPNYIIQSFCCFEQWGSFPPYLFSFQNLWIEVLCAPVLSNAVLCKRDVNWSIFKIIIPFNDLGHYKKICTSNVTIKLGIWVPEFGGLWRHRYTQPYDTTGILSLSVHRITQLLSRS